MTTTTIETTKAERTIPTGPDPFYLAAVQLQEIACQTDWPLRRAGFIALPERDHPDIYELCDQVQGHLYSAMRLMQEASRRMASAWRDGSLPRIAPGDRVQVKLDGDDSGYIIEATVVAEHDDYATVRLDGRDEDERVPWHRLQLIVEQTDDEPDDCE